MTKTANPLELWATGCEAARIGLEANSIVAMRMLGMMGLWKVRDTEVVRMVVEKPAAFAEAWMAGFSAAVSGAAPDGILSASLKPIGRATKSNHRRLSRAGARF